MIFGTGVDIVEVFRMRDAIKKWGENFLEKIFTAREIKYSNSPQLSKGNFNAFEDLNAPMNYVVTPSSDDYLFKERIRVCSLRAFISNYLPLL